MSNQIEFACKGDAGLHLTLVKFHLPISLILCKAVQVILQNLATHCGFYTSTHQFELGLGDPYLGLNTIIECFIESGSGYEISSI